jgi:peroxiredoxin
MVTSSSSSGLFNGLISERSLRNFVPVPATSPLRLGAKTPDFTLPDITNDRQVTLSDYRGKQPVLVAFTRIFTEKHYCPMCYPHIIEMNENYHRFIEKGVEVLTITSTDTRQSQQVVKDLQLKMPLLSDPSCNTFRAYEVGQALGAPLPGQFLLDGEGKLRYKHLFSFLDANASIERLMDAIAAL